MALIRILIAVCAAAMAAAPQTQPEALRTLEYARPQSGALLLDLYLPPSGGPFPLIVWIHGGAFRAGNKGGIWYKPILNQTRRGYAVASIDYRLSGTAQFPALVQDAKAAIRWLRASAAQFHLNTDRIVVAGESAGGYQAAMLGTTGGVTELEGALGSPKDSSRVQGVIDFFGPTDFLAMDDGASSCKTPMVHRTADSPESLLLGCNLDACPEKVKAANPITYVSRDDPPFLILHGTADCLVPHSQSQRLYDALRAAGDKADLHLLPGVGHADQRFMTSETEKWVSDFVDSVLR
ncbi:MAG: alpha/beta hydrolase [Acidobacteriia bacterium]|nr:alpha/beta hydrolase [Terriglobia bacterium]